MPDFYDRLVHAGEGVDIDTHGLMYAIRDFFRPNSTVTGAQFFSHFSISADDQVIFLAIKAKIDDATLTPEEAADIFGLAAVGFPEHQTKAELKARFGITP